MIDLSQDGLIAALKGVLQDAAVKFTAAGDADFIRHLDVARADLARVRPNHQLAEVALQADVSTYPLPADFIGMLTPLWGNAERRNRKQWESRYPGPAPVADVIYTQPLKSLVLTPAPTAAQITDLGSAYRFYYNAKYLIDADASNTTVRQEDADLLLIRAAAHALHELALNGVTKPVQLGKAGVGAMPKNGTPAALAELLMKLFWSMAGV